MNSLRSFFSIFLLFILLNINSSLCYAMENQDSVHSNTCFINADSVLSFRSPKGFVPSLLFDFKDQFLAPFRMSFPQFVQFMTATGTTMVMFSHDEWMDEKVRNLKAQHDWINTLSPQITSFGNDYATAVICLYAGYGALAKDRKAFQTSLLAAQAAITAGVWVRLGKYVTSRERPGVTYGHPGHEGGYWYSPFEELKSTSKNKSVALFDAFPSGHTSTAFSIATVFAMQYSDKKAVPVIAYSMATLVGFSRMTEHEHWISDVFVGACTGYLCGRQVVIHHRKLFNTSSSAFFQKKKGRQLHLAPSANMNGLSLTATW